MKSVRLKNNSNKSKFIIFGNRIQVNTCATNGLNMEGETFYKSKMVKYLEACLDIELTLKTHVKKKCASDKLNSQRIKSIWKYLTIESCTKLVVSICLSHIGYSNSILYGLPNSTVKQMQNIQNYGAKLVLGRNYAGCQ